MSERPLIGFLVLLFVFVPLERFFPRHKRRFFFREHFFGDLVHFFINQFFIQAGLIAVILLILYIGDGLISRSFQAAVAAQPGWLQFVEALLIAELFGY